MHAHNILHYKVLLNLTLNHSLELSIPCWIERPALRLRLRGGIVEIRRVGRVPQDSLLRMKAYFLQVGTYTRIWPDIQGDHVGLTLDFVDINLRDPPVCPFAMPSLP